MDRTAPTHMTTLRRYYIFKTFEQELVISNSLTYRYTRNGVIDIDTEKDISHNS